MGKTIGLALGGGGARGWAHIGAIRALEEASIPIHVLAGTSIGSMVGAFYAADVLDKLETFANEVTLQTLLGLMDISFPGTGLINGDRIHDFVSGYVLDICLEDSRIPFRCVATNFLQKREVVLQTGLMADAVRASISIPGIFAPVQQEENVYLVDGGVVNPVPVSVVRSMGADIVIAVNLNKDPKTINSSSNKTTADATDLTDTTDTTSTNIEDQGTNGEPDGFLSSLSNRYDHLKDLLQDQVDDWIPDPQQGLNIFDVLGNSINVMEQRVTEANLAIDQPDVLIEPNLIKYGIFDFHQAKPIIQQGYDTAQQMLPKIRDVVSKS